MTRFSSFTDDELDKMEEAFCNEGLKGFVDEVRTERRIRIPIFPKYKVINDMCTGDVETVNTLY